MDESWLDRLTSRKFIAFGVGLVGAFLYAFHAIDSTGLTAIIAAAGTYQVGEGLADLGQSKARTEAAAEKQRMDRVDAQMAQLSVPPGQLGDGSGRL